MRKNIIALMLILPLLFVLVVFSSGNVASLGVIVSVNGIKIDQNFENDTINLDLAEEKTVAISATVLPANAQNKAYSFVTREVDGAPLADVSVEEGHIVARSSGTARLVAVSRDGGYEDAVTVVVGSSKPYDFTVALLSGDGKTAELQKMEEEYYGTVPTGQYTYLVTSEPRGFTGASVAVEEGFAVLDEGMGAFLLPFSGKTTLTFTLKGGIGGDIVRRVHLDVTRAATASGFVVNGGAGVAVSFETGSTEGSLYVEADGTPSIAPNANLRSSSVTHLGNGHYRVDLFFAEGHDSAFRLAVSCGEEADEVLLSFLDFAFAVRSDLPVQGEDPAILVGVPTSFYAYPAAGMSSRGVEYRWSAQGEGVTLTVSASTASCTVLAEEGGEFTLTVQAYRGNAALDVPAVTVRVEAVRRVSSVQIANRAGVGLAHRTTVAGKRADGSANEYPLQIFAYDVDTPVPVDRGITVKSSDDRIARVEQREDGFVLLPVGKGEVTVTAEWDGNETFATSMKTSLTLNVVSDALEVNTSAELFAQTEAGKAVVLGRDIMLGTDNVGRPLSVEARRALFTEQQHVMNSTFNVEYYRNTGETEQAKVKYVLEFKNDVYGNGHTINAEYYTNVKEGTGNPSADFFRGPLSFVKKGEVASVAGQDNIAFLIRTDGVTLYNVDLLGCSDASLEAEGGGYDLAKLNFVGTTLEVNASASLYNCRIRNGRNVVRVYGGYRDADGDGFNDYFLSSLDHASDCEDERAVVTIGGCVLSQAREFILKIGTNRALLANSSLSSSLEACIEPFLTDAEGHAYKSQTDEYVSDSDFYAKYVMTDVTLADSVLETSGLFTVGVESNFAGALLYRDAESGIFPEWQGTGGTSFAAILRLKGDVRLYDWKRLDLVDSSTLIETASPEFGERFSLNIKAMLNFARNYDAERYGKVIFEREGMQYVHGGIAFYGGGRNYSQLSLEELDGDLKEGLSTFFVNISLLTHSDDSAMQDQGNTLPAAAGKEDFRFYLYDADSPNSLQKQQEDEAAGEKYSGIHAYSPF